MPAGLELRLVLAREDTVDAGEDARAVRRSLQLLVVGVLDVGDSLPHLRERLAVAEPARVDDCVDGEPDRLKRCEEHLRSCAWELGRFGERSEREHRLVAASLLGVDLERKLALGDRRVRAAPEVVAERLELHAAAWCADHERVGLPVTVEVGLCDAATGTAPEQPLQLARVRAAGLDDAAESLVDPLLAALPVLRARRW